MTRTWPLCLALTVQGWSESGQARGPRATLLTLRRLLRTIGWVLEHAVRVGRRFRNVLDHIPVLNHLVTFKPEEIRDGQSGLSGRQRQVRVRYDHLILCNRSLCVQMHFGELLAEGVNKFDECVRAIPN